MRASEAALGSAMCVGEGGRELDNFIAKRLAGGVAGGVMAVDEPRRLLKAFEDVADRAEAELDLDRAAEGRCDSATNDLHMTEISVEARACCVLLDTV